MPGEGMGIGNNRAQQFPAPFRDHTPGGACLPFPIAHIIVARSRDYEQRSCAERVENRQLEQALAQLRRPVVVRKTGHGLTIMRYKVLVNT